MKPRSETPRPAFDLQLPASVADVLERRIASHNWDANRVAAAAILHFIENADMRADMLRRLIEVQGGATPHTPPEDVLEHHRDEVFSIASADVTTSDSAQFIDSPPASEDVITGHVTSNPNDTTFTLDEIAENLARFNEVDRPSS